MSGVDIAAVITSLLALAAWGTLLRQLSDPADRKMLLLLLLAALPLSPAVFHWVRLPLDAGLKGALGTDSTTYQFLRLCYAPLTEEPAKLIPLLLLLVPGCRGWITKQNTAPIALALGLGFGIGEIWLLANMLRSNPEIAKLPYYQLGGFLQERLIVCLTHAGFTVLAVWGLRRGWRWFPVGLLGAMTLHFFGNFPILLKQKDVGGLGEGTWNWLIMLWLVAYLFGTLVLLCVLRFGWSELGRLVFGKARCPSCGELYSRPIFGLNAGMRRYERCPLCGRWHWIDARNNVANRPDQRNGVSADSK